MVAIPSQVKVGNLVYEVLVTDEILLLNGKQCRGMIDFERQTIKIAGDYMQSEQGQLWTFFHELIHALTHSRFIDWGDKDEFYTDELATAMHGVVIDNRWIISNTEKKMNIVDHGPGRGMEITYEEETA